MRPRLHIATHDLPDAEAAVRGLRQDADELAARFPALTACRLSLSRDRGLGYEAHLELLFPQHQVVVNGGGSTAEQARKAALAAAAQALAELARRDPTVAARGAHAKAA